MRNRRRLALVLEKVLLPKNRLAIEQLGRDNGIAELFKELRVVGAVDR
jgi:hypothetical protein